MRSNIMQKVLFFIWVGITIFALSAAAQDTPKAEVFGGYQYTQVGGVVNANGWNAAVTGNVNRWFGVTADFSGAYKSVGTVNANALTYTFGPVFSMRNKRVTPFAHALFGGFHVSAGFLGANASTNGFAAIVGGGVDVKVTSHVAVRAIQADWILWRTLGLTEEKNGRISAGLVFRF
jgi:hypothetical protein